MGIDTLFLYGKDAYGSILTIEKFPVGASQNSYTWKGPGSFSQPPRMYVFVGKGPNAAPRSNIVWIDPSLRGNPSAGTFFAWLSQMRSGVQINWRADSSLLSTDADTIIVSKRFGPQTGYKRWSVSRGATGSIWDSDFKEVAAGTTVYYKIEILSTKAVPPSQEVKFDVTREFLDRMPKRLSVGKYGQYATIQLAVDAANDGDVIEIGPAASGVYKEKVSLKGKAVSLEADWRDGAPPVIDAEGGLAILVPYTPKSMDNGTIGIGGLKIINALTGVAAYANVSVHQCLFVNNVREAVLCMVDSAAVVKAALTDPFAQFQINADFWQCTFVGNSSTPVAIRASSGASGAADSSGLIRTQMAPSGYIKVNNSIFFRYASSVLPVDAKDDRVAVSVHNCDFWRTSMAVSSARVKLEAENFQIDPAFKDTVNYFLPDSSSLRGMADNGASVGYDGNRGGSRNGDQGDTGQKAAIPAVRDLKLKVSGPHTIFLSWSPLPDTAVFSAYMVMRVDAVDSRFTVDAQSKWTLTVPKDSILSFIDTFRTAATTFSDTTAIAGRSYIYAVAGVDSTGEIGEVDMPASLPLSAYTVTIGIPAKIGAMTAKIQGFSTINLTWKRPASVSPSTAYEVYRFSGGDSLVAAAGDSARVRRLAFTAKQGGAAVAFAARDTVLIDNVASLGLSYLYIASVADSIIPFESRPLTWTAVKIDSLPYQESRPVSVVANRWNMIGPWGVGATSGDNAGTIVYRWDDDKAADKLYSQYASASALQGGAGYWFKAAADTVLAVTPVMHRAVIQRRDSLFVKLRKGLTGWNQVASPLPFPVSPAWLKNGIFTAYAWEGDSNQYTDQTVLKPWRGYWIHTDRDTTLAVKPSDVAASDLGRPLGKRLSAAAWELQVSLSGDGCDPDNFIGVISPEASRLRKLVYPEPPRAFDYAQLFIVETGGDKAAEPKQCAKLYKVSGADVAKKLEWMVGISPSASAATIRVKGAERLPEKVLLFWISGAAAINLRENAEISVPAHAENVYGYIVATSNPRDVGIYTRSFELRGCFPNPVRNNAVIDFTVPYSWNKDGSKREGETRELTLGVYDMAGRCVATVFSGSVCVGDHRLAWRGASDAGYAVAQGAYVIRLAGGDFQRTLRIMKLR
jgi:hypothetical protein